MTEAKLYGLGLCLDGIVVEASAIDIAAWAQLEYQGGSTKERPSRTIGIKASLEAEGGVAIDT